MNVKIIIALSFLFNVLIFSQPQFIVKTIDGFDNFKLGTNFAEPYIVTNPNDPLNSACVFYTLSYNCQAYYTLNGHDWLSSPLTFGYVNSGADPFIATDKYGNFFITVLTGFPSFNGFSVAKSTNGGINWSYHRVFDGFLDKECIVGDITNGPYGGFLYTAWQDIHNDSVSMSFSRSTNGGVGWSNRIRVNNSDDNYCPYLAIGPNGNIDGGSVYYGYNAADSVGNLSVKVKRSTNAGISFLNEYTAAINVRNPQPIKGLIYTSSCIQMAADNSNTPSRGNVYVIYAHNPPGNDNSDVYFSRSLDLGVTWEVPRKLNEDNTLTDQWMPAISCDKETGKVFVSWFDSRFDPANLQVKLYGTVSTNGGVSFAPSSSISNQPFTLSGTNFWGHYMGISAIKNTSYAAWTDNRENSYGSYTAFYPDYAFVLSPDFRLMSGNDSFNVTLNLPAVNGPFDKTVKFSVALETLPTQGNFNVSFVNNRDSISVIPDSIGLKIKTTGNVTPGRYRMVVTSRATDGVPVHKRYIDLLVNYSFLSVGTNRNGIVNFKVNDSTFNKVHELYRPNNTTINLQALTPQTFLNKRYHFLNWTNNGDTIHNVTLNNDRLYITANYKTQFKLLMDTTIGNTFGGNIFYDSSASISFGVHSRNYVHNGNHYRFGGWSGNGQGSYTSPDSTGNDTLVTLQLNSVISQNPRWLSIIGIQPVTAEIPTSFKLNTNYPNPFNPVTKIKIDIAKNTDAKLIVYDVLGRVVKTLINEELKAGKYEVDFDGFSLSSGVYFYKLVTNDFVDTKRMLMIK